MKTRDKLSLAGLGALTLITLCMSIQSVVDGDIGSSYSSVSKPIMFFVCVVALIVFIDRKKTRNTKCNAIAKVVLIGLALTAVVAFVGFSVLHIWPAERRQNDMESYRLFALETCSNKYNTNFNYIDLGEPDSNAWFCALDEHAVKVQLSDGSRCFSAIVWEDGNGNLNCRDSYQEQDIINSIRESLFPDMNPNQTVVTIWGMSSYQEDLFTGNIWSYLKQAHASKCKIVILTREPYVESLGVDKVDSAIGGNKLDIELLVGAMAEKPIKNLGLTSSVVEDLSVSSLHSSASSIPSLINLLPSMSIALTWGVFKHGANVSRQTDVVVYGSEAFERLYDTQKPQSDDTMRESKLEPLVTCSYTGKESEFTLKRVVYVMRAQMEVWKAIGPYQSIVAKRSGYSSELLDIKTGCDFCSIDLTNTNNDPSFLIMGQR